jgi:hypothetical protein
VTDAKAIRNSVEGRDPFTDPADAIGRLRASSQRGPSATELHKRATVLHVYNEENGGELLGVFSNVIEDTVFYFDAARVTRVAPVDCVTVRP